MQTRHPPCFLPRRLLTVTDRPLSRALPGSVRGSQHLLKARRGEDLTLQSVKLLCFFGKSYFLW